MSLAVARRMHPMMRLGDAGADIRVHVEAIIRAVRADGVGFVDKERDFRAGNRGQFLPGRLQVDAPCAAGDRRRRKRNDLRRYKARGIGPERSSVARTSDIVLDVVDLGVKIKSRATAEATKGEVSRAIEARHRDVNPSLQEIVRSNLTITAIANVGDVEAQIENIGTGRSVVNDLDCR